MGVKNARPKFNPRMKRLLLCLCLSAYTAVLVTRFQWEEIARREWHAYAEATLDSGELQD